ncbi:MAG: phosphate-starvation-inducible PsiE family protein [Gammaproteobacteria bacterium]|jgi:uncharacterized membrane protein (DUF373 family)|nr:phosphate-starvation-inducible PsiE family protein [Gammaproteobacteria bacterium]
MLRVTYVSSATSAMSKDDLMALLHQCREYNSENGITGMLLYSNGTFLQVLEGNETEIDSLLATISTDPRHTDVRMLDRQPIEQRMYGDWSMGFKRVSARELKQVPGLRKFSLEDFNTVTLSRDKDAIDSLMTYFRGQRMKAIGQSELSLDEDDQLINVLNRAIRAAVRVLAVLMVFTIFWGVIDVVYVLYDKVLMPTLEDFRARDIIVTFGAFLTVLIAIEIFLNITLYLRDDVIHIRLVISTALMAIARKVIILDFDKVQPLYMFATAAVVLALGITYWLVENRTVPAKDDRWE